MPAAPVKITRPLAALLLRDLPAFLAVCEKAGKSPPKLELRYADGLTREDARTLYEWGLKVPEFNQALRDSNHADHASLRAYMALTNYFTHDHPQRPEGGPADWDTPLSPALAAYILGDAAGVESKSLSQGEAADFLSYYETRGDLVQGAMTSDSPQHASISRELVELHLIAAGPDAVALDAGKPKGDEVTVSPQNQARIDEINLALRDPKLPKGSAERAALLAELLTAFTAPPAGSPEPRGGSTNAPPAALKSGAARIAELNAVLRDPLLPTASADRQAALVELHAALASPAATGSNEEAVPAAAV